MPSIKGVQVVTDKHEIKGLSEGLDHKGMQARVFPIAEDFYEAIKKEAVLGLTVGEVGLGVAGFITCIIGGYLQVVPPHQRDGATAYVLKSVAEALDAAKSARGEE